MTNSSLATRSSAQTDFLQSSFCLGVIAMPIIDRTYGTIDVIEDALLHNARATELRESCSRRAAHAQPGMIGIGALVTRAHVGDNAGSQQ